MLFTFDIYLMYTNLRSWILGVVKYDSCPQKLCFRRFGHYFGMTWFGRDLLNCKTMDKKMLLFFAHLPKKPQIILPLPWNRLNVVQVFAAFYAAFLYLSHFFYMVTLEFDRRGPTRKVCSVGNVTNIFSIRIVWHWIFQLCQSS